MPILEIKSKEGEVFNTCKVICLNADGDELDEKDGSKISESIFEALKASKDNPLDDLFIISHGWMGDADGAVEQYTKWIEAMHASRLTQRHLPFNANRHRAGVIGIHWPSRPVGNEVFPESDVNEVGFEGLEVLPPSTKLVVDKFIESCSNSIVDSKEAREAYALLAAEADKEISDEDIGLEANWIDGIKSATKTIIDEIDKAKKKAEQQFRASTVSSLTRASELIAAASKSSEGQASRDGLVAKVANLLSFYQMKERADLVGRKCAKILDKIAAELPAHTRVHLMGHSFGCIVVSSMLTNSTFSNRKLSSLALVQGALSLWSYSEAFTGMDGPGKYRAILSKVSGPIITTTSVKDTAVGMNYPAAVSSLDPERYETQHVYKSYGGLGSFGARGYGITSCDLLIQPVTHLYDFKSGVVYNICADTVIGDHCDIARPEVANAVWQAALARNTSELN